LIAYEGTHFINYQIPDVIDEYDNEVDYIEGSGNLKVSSGLIIVSDPCYIIEDDLDWRRFLMDTHYINQPADGTIVLDEMGGDGTYDVILY